MFYVNHDAYVLPTLLPITVAHINLCKDHVARTALSFIKKTIHTDRTVLEDPGLRRRRLQTFNRTKQ